MLDTSRVTEAAEFADRHREQRVAAEVGGLRTSESLRGVAPQVGSPLSYTGNSFDIIEG